MLNIASLGMRFNLHNVKCRFARYAFKKKHVPFPRSWRSWKWFHLALLGTAPLKFVNFV